MTEPKNAADLTSQTGWAKVDYDRRKWIPCLAAMPDGYDTARWAREFSAAWWSMSGLPHAENDMARLEAQLAVIRDSTYGHILCHLAFIHLPDPRLNPLPVYLAILQASGERDTQLRTLTMVNDPKAVRPPIIEEFRTGRLGSGLRVMRYCAEDAPEAPTSDTPEIYAGLSYAWRSEQFQTDLRLYTACPDLGRLQQAIPDIDELARSITAIPAP
jgi:hypothetical protein